MKISRSAALAVFQELIPSRRQRWLLVMGFWTLLGLVSALVWILLRFDDQPYTWNQLIRGKFLVWWLWGLITPLVLLIGARFSLLSTHKLSRAVVLLTLSLVVTLGYMFGYAALVFFAEPVSIVGPDYYRLANWVIWTHWGYFYVGYWLTIAVEHVAEQMRRTHEASLAKEKLERELASARLAQVSQQMHPHFLFNTLNTIASQVLTGDRHQAYDLVSGLANYLRHGLVAGEAQFSSLKNEMSLIEEYLSLIHARYPDRLTVEANIAEETLSLQIPSLLLQPLVENAVTHAVARFDTRTTLRIGTELIAEHLQIVVSNTTSQVHYPAAPYTQSRTNFGIRSTRERLELSYGQDAQLSVESDTSSFRVTLKLPARIIAEIESGSDPMTETTTTKQPIHATSSRPDR